MSRWRLALVLSAVLAGSATAQQNPSTPLPPDEDAPPGKSVQKSAPRPESQAKPGQPKTSSNDDELPPDEDASSAPKEKPSFNPVKSRRDVETGKFYLKKGNFKAAADRFREATQYNDGNKDAWLLLAEAEEKREVPKEARAAYERYLQLTPDAKNAAEIKKRLERLK